MTRYVHFCKNFEFLSGGFFPYKVYVNKWKWHFSLYIVFRTCHLIKKKCNHIVKNLICLNSVLNKPQNIHNLSLFTIWMRCFLFLFNNRPTGFDNHLSTIACWWTCQGVSRLQFKLYFKVKTLITDSFDCYPFFYYLMSANIGSGEGRNGKKYKENISGRRANERHKFVDQIFR